MSGEVVVGEEHRVGRAERCAGVLEIGGRAKAIVNASAATNNGFLIERPREADTRSPIVAVGGNAAAESTLIHKERGAVDRSRRLTGKENDGLAGIAGEIAELLIVVAFGVRRTPLVTEAEVDGELWRDLPVVLHVESGFHRFVGNARGNAETAGIAIAHEEAGERVALRGVAALGRLRGDVLREMEAAGRIGRLIEIVEEYALLEADFEGVAILDERNGGRIAVEGVSEAGVGAALRVHRQLVVIGVEVDGRHASEAVDVETRRETDAGEVGQRRVNGSVDAIEGEAAGDERGRSEGVVHFDADVMDVGERSEAVVEVAAAEDERNVEFGVELAVANADAKFVAEVVIDFHVELVAGSDGEDRGAEIVGASDGIAGLVGLGIKLE